MADAMSTAGRLKRALQWEKAVIIFSFWLCVAMFLLPGVLLGRFVAPALLDTRPIEFPMLMHLVIGGFIGLVGIGTIINAGNLLYRVAIDAVRGRTGSG